MRLHTPRVEPGNRGRYRPSDLRGRAKGAAGAGFQAQRPGATAGRPAGQSVHRAVDGCHRRLESAGWALLSLTGSAALGFILLGGGVNRREGTLLSALSVGLFVRLFGRWTRRLAPLMAAEASRE